MATVQTNPGAFAHSIKKSDMPTTSQVSPNGVSAAKSGTGAKMDKSLLNDGKNNDIPPEGSPQPKKGSGAKMDFGYIKSQASETIDCSSISAAK